MPTWLPVLVALAFALMWGNRHSRQQGRGSLSAPQLPVLVLVMAHTTPVVLHEWALESSGPACF